MAHVFAFVTTVHSEHEIIRTHLVYFALVEPFWFPPSRLQVKLLLFQSCWDVQTGQAKLEP